MTLEKDGKRILFDGAFAKDILLVDLPQTEHTLSSTVDKTVCCGGINYLINWFKTEGFEVKNENYRIQKDAFYHISKWARQVIENEDRLFLSSDVGIYEEEFADTGVKDFIAGQLDGHEIVAIYDASDYLDYSYISGIDNRPWIIIRACLQSNRKYSGLIKKMCEPEHCIRREKTIVILSVNEMRNCGFEINEGVSWEQLTYQTCNSIENSETLSKFGYIIVCFGQEGCLIWSREKTYLVYYPTEIEGDYCDRVKRNVFGKMHTFHFAFIRVLALLLSSVEELDICKLGECAKVGLNAMRLIISVGYSSTCEYPLLEVRTLIKKDFEKIKSSPRKETSEWSSICLCSKVITEDIFFLLKTMDKDKLLGEKIVKHGIHCVSGANFLKNGKRNKNIAIFLRGY